ncbi:hypothetical protein SKAU_G00178820 [Synaphobranchus kaupii]|uniref:Glucagon / GIP / secretin / VIP family domain-containing protein n=1 Tax=Synaphobranchus kaupii TaxID=118154 RepID=A0A9Q1FLR9_SYNKA|nr:hypothetical protein SKAU_G00178820 [Synaphobranchus kaupii]
MISQRTTSIDRIELWKSLGSHHLPNKTQLSAPRTAPVKDTIFKRTLKAMLPRNGSQLLLLIALCSVLYTRTLSLPYPSMRLGKLESDNENDWTKSPSDSLPENYKLYYDFSNAAAARPTRHADGLFTSGYSKLLGQLSARRYLESLIGKRVSNEFMEEQMPVKRHSDAIFTDNYSRFRKQMAVKKYLNSVLTGKRRYDEESYDDVSVDELLSHLPLTL